MFNRPKTVPYFTHSLVLCKNRLLTVTVLLSRFKLFSSKYLNKLPSIYQGTVDLSANDDLELKTEPPN